MVDWKIELDEDAQDDLRRYDLLEANAILRYLYREIATRMDPCSVGERLGSRWRYETNRVSVVVRILKDRRVIRVSAIDKQ
jgi:hypothetical protein